MKISKQPHFHIDGENLVHLRISFQIGIDKNRRHYSLCSNYSRRNSLDNKKSIFVITFSGHFNDIGTKHIFIFLQLRDPKNSKKLAKIMTVLEICLRLSDQRNMIYIFFLNVHTSSFKEPWDRYVSPTIVFNFGMVLARCCPTAFKHQHYQGLRWKCWVELEVDQATGSTFSFKRPEGWCVRFADPPQARNWTQFLEPLLPL